MINQWGYLLTNMLHFWKPYLVDLAEKARLKLVSNGVPSEPGNFRIIGFIDCTVIASCRPGGGPAEGGGAGAPRYNNYIQMAFYNGWKHHHGTKFQTVENVLGMCMHLYGPDTFRSSDVVLLRDSRILQKLQLLQEDMPRQYAIYGDGIYPNGDYIVSRANGLNDGMASIRICNEWDYGITAMLFPFVKHRAAQKLRKHRDIPNYYIIATIFRNINAALYGNVNSNYFCSEDVELESRLDIRIADYLDIAHKP